MRGLKTIAGIGALVIALSGCSVPSGVQNVERTEQQSTVAVELIGIPQVPKSAYGQSCGTLTFMMPHDVFAYATSCGPQAEIAGGETLLEYAHENSIEARVSGSYDEDDAFRVSAIKVEKHTVQY